MGMSNISKSHWPIAAIIGLWLIFSFPYFLKGLVPFPSTYLATFFPPWSSEYGMPVKNNAMPDVITQIYPWKKLTIDTWKSGEVPMWNPYSFSGTAHAGNYQSAVFSPLNVLFFILPFIDAWSILILLQPLLAGLFMYLFVKSLGRSREASLLAAIAFMFCGFMVVWMAYGTLGYAALFLPLIFWGIHKKYGWPISLGIVLSLVSGHFQVSIYVIGAAAAYILWKKQWRTLWFVLLGLLIAAPQILLGLRSFALSARGAAVLRGEIIPWQYLLTFIAPDFFGNPVTRNDWFGHYAEWAGFVGVIPLLLAVFAATKKTLREGWFFVLLAVLTLLFALPTPLNDLLYVLKIPVLSGSAASRIILLTSFSLATLAAFGLDALIADWKDNRRKKIIIFALVCVGLLGLTWLVLLLAHPLPVDKLAIAKRNFVLPSMIVLAGVALFISGLIRKKWLKIGIVSIILAATAFDLLRFAVKWMPFDPRKYMYPEIKSLTYLQSRVGNDRVFGNIGSGEVGTQFRIPLVEGYDAVYQARYGEFISAASEGTLVSLNRSVVLLDKNGLYTRNILEFLGARYILHRKSDGRNIWAYPFWKYPSYRVVYSDDAYEVWENPDAYPRAFLASSYTIEATGKDIIDKLFAKDFDRRNTIVFEEEPFIQPQPGTGSAYIAAYRSNKVTVETDASSPKLLFLSDVYDAGWHATVDGKKSPVYRADYDFRAVAVPAGKHTVEFRYHSDEFRWGIMLSIVGVVGLFYLVKRI
jgi:hypothetical protein